MKLKDKKIAIYKAIHGLKDSEGFTKKQWQPIHTGMLWAYTRQLSAKEFFAAAAQQFQEERLFVINWRTDIAPGIVIRYRDNWFEIVRVDPLEDYKADIKLYVKEAICGTRPKEDEFLMYRDIIGK